jgi:hypothetical protein
MGARAYYKIVSGFDVFKRRSNDFIAAEQSHISASSTLRSDNVNFIARHSLLDRGCACFDIRAIFAGSFVTREFSPGNFLRLLVRKRFGFSADERRKLRGSALERCVLQ